MIYNAHSRATKCADDTNVRGQELWLTVESVVMFLIDMYSYDL